MGSTNTVNTGSNKCVNDTCPNGKGTNDDTFDTCSKHDFVHWMCPRGTSQFLKYVELLYALLSDKFAQARVSGDMYLQEPVSPW